MNHWIALNGADYDAVKKTSKQGIVFEESISPYDIPQALRAFKTADEKWHIELRYLAAEPVTHEKLLNVSLQKGKNSGRIYSIIIGPISHQADAAAIVQQIQKALGEKLRELAKKSKSSDENSEIAKRRYSVPLKIAEAYGSELFATA